jgi:hypothetical protein
MRRTAVAAALCFAACGTEPIVAPGNEPLMSGVGEGPAKASASCVLAPVQSGWIPRRLPCGYKVRVSSSNPDISSRLQAAVNLWNSAGLGQNGLPSFTATGTANDTATIVLSGSSNTQSPWYCGDTQPGVLQITIFQSDIKSQCGGGGFTNATQIGNLTGLIAHELSHVIGFKHISQNNSKPAADHCAASIPANGLINSGLCQAEIQLLRYEYGLRDGVVDPAKHIATGVEVSGPRTLTLGAAPGTLTITNLLFGRAAPSFSPPAASSQAYTWTLVGNAISLSGSGASRTVQTVQTGTATISIRLSNHNTFEEADPFTGGDITFTVTAAPTAPPPPTSLTASAIGVTSATIGWVNGATDAGTTTTLQYRKSGVPTWTTASSTIGAGVTSHNLTNLTSNLTYDVRAWHVRNGLSSTITTKAGLFTTLDPNAVPTITNFRVTRCDPDVVGAKTFNYFTLSWDSNFSPGGSFQIGVNTNSSSAGATVIVTVPGSARSGVVGGYLAGPTTVSRWFWVRYQSGPWIPLAGNPLATNICAI